MLTIFPVKIQNFSNCHIFLLSQKWLHGLGKHFFWDTQSPVILMLCVIWSITVFTQCSTQNIILIFLFQDLWFQVYTWEDHRWWRRLSKPWTWRRSGRDGAWMCSRKISSSSSSGRGGTSRGAEQKFPIPEGSQRVLVMMYLLKWWRVLDGNTGLEFSPSYSVFVFVLQWSCVLLHPSNCRKLGGSTTKTGRRPEEDKVLEPNEVQVPSLALALTLFILILGPRRRDRSRGQLLVTKTRSITLRFDTDFDFDSSNAQFIKEKLEVEGQRSNVKGWSREEINKFIWYPDPKVEGPAPYFGNHCIKCYFVCRCGRGGGEGRVHGGGRSLQTQMLRQNQVVLRQLLLW